MGKKYLNYFILLVLKLICISFNKKIIIPIKLIDHSNTGLNYIESLLQKQLYAEIKLGTPEQKIYLSISTETESFSIESKYINENFYFHNASSTHINTENKVSLFHERYASGKIFKDSFYFNIYFNSKIVNVYKNISFDYIFELSKEYTINEKPYYVDKEKNQISGTIGLQISKSYMSSSNFLKSLYKANVIEASIWSLKFDKENKKEGYLIVGENLFDNKEDGKRANAYLSGIDSYWYFIFNYIQTENTKFLNGERKAEYAPQIGVIIGTNEYKSYINQNFFADLLENNMCSQKNVTVNRRKYSYYECDKNIDINNFEPLIFIHQEFSYNFTLDSNDLFVDYNDKKYFLCVFLENENRDDNDWVLGIPFVKKYNFVFDHDSKIIIFYEKDYEIRKNNRKIGWVAWIFIVILIIITSLLTLYLLFKIIFRPKKIIANELEDSFNIKNRNNDLDLNTFYNSKYNKLGI